MAKGLEKSVMVATPKATTTDSSEASGDTSSPTSAPPRPPLSPSSSPRRASYESFETCEEVSAQFGGSAAARRATGSLFPTAQSEPSNHFPQFPPDYCEHCNCSIPRKTDNERMYAFGDAPMAAAPGRPLLRLPLPLLRGLALRKLFFGPQTDSPMAGAQSRRGMHRPRQTGAERKTSQGRTIRWSAWTKPTL